MLSWFQALMPKEEKFFDMFEKHSRVIVDGALSLRSLVEGGERVPEHCRAVAEFEHQADIITRDVLLAVRRTFITPFDRSDIRDLISSMDDTIDQMKQTAKVITLYEIRDFDPPARKMADIIVQAADLTREAVPLLRRMNQNAAKLNVYAEEITKIEEEADGIHDHGLKDLFRQHGASNPMGFIVGRELYSHLEKVVDGFEDVANRISSIVIEHI